MTQAAIPRKHPSNFEPGEEFKPIELVLSREMVNYFIVAINDRHPWYIETSPFGGQPVIPPLMVHPLANTRLVAKHIFDDFPGDLLTEPAGVHYTFEAEYFHAVKVGEKVTIKGKCLASYTKRGRKYVDFVGELYGEDGRLCSRYVHTHTYKMEAE